MSVCSDALVSVVTPVYNGEPYLAECVESVLAQTYRNWEYILVNNCSADGTLKVAERYARLDERIRVCDNDTFLDIISNHNKAFRTISASSKYCKVVSADDFVFPECLARMVGLAESHPSVGIVGSYQLSGGDAEWYVRTDGLPYRSTVVPGRDIGRAHLLGTLNVLGNPTSNLYRSDLVRSTDAFYPNSTAEADISACFECLKATDFGFVHQVLSYERLHKERITTTSQGRNAYLSSKLSDLLTYGPFYLTEGELQGRLKELLDEYYRFLAISAVNMRGREFWSYHRERLKQLGYSLDRIRLGKAVCAKCLDLLLNPKQTAEKAVRRMRASAYGAAPKRSERSQSAVAAVKWEAANAAGHKKQRLKIGPPERGDCR
jgi:glycosyltransferase involved in cell wall biosynthesis